ncbi:MAG: diapolycopene oxygenase, partial [Verrucomicrobia bacterium]|nr:diapolycopene oxygenase [Verrucomicrobiota bacterium]
MNAMPTIQFRYDLWYVDGGLYNIALGLKRFMDELGIRVTLNAEVREVRRENGRVTGIVANGTFHAADIIVSNMEVIPAYEGLL